MDRRAFIAGTLSLVVAPLAQAQPAARIPRIGFLSPLSPSAEAVATWYEAFRQGLRDLGYVEGQNIIIEWRWAGEKYDRLPELAAELVRLKVDVIVTHGAGPQPGRPVEEGRLHRHQLPQRGEATFPQQDPVGDDQAFKPDSPEP